MNLSQILNFENKGHEWYQHFMFPIWVASKASLIEKAAKKEKEGSTLREREEKKQRENWHMVTDR